ncbi:hypothetical protein SAMN04489760_13037 [Syntrophus gentianae]|uniref:PsbP C-terminal domain-containing protein n=1 Tax=Syntrophus gentianae TaxID=43775 RepID=A0A1H8A4C9_9BACT|nr:hypothetical protein [Syntrophus gentianae]SEM65366.1 hypothetical protein SAMN04489760_13037 [Syntrophus gentianae]
MKKCWLVLILLVLTACAPWARVGGDYREESQNYSVTLPEGWMKSNTVNDLLVTHDGVLLQTIRIERFKTDQELKHTRKKYSRNMLPQEMADVAIDNIKSDPMITNFKLLESSPATLSGIPGFKIVYEFKTKEGQLRFKCIYYGIMSGEWNYGIWYRAAARHYFDKDVQTFETVSQSFRLLKP